MTRISIKAALEDKGQKTPWHLQAAALISKHMYLKAIGTMIFISLFFAAYFYLLKYPAYTTSIMPITWLDHLIGFQPHVLPIYLSLWVYVSLPPALLATPRELYDYGLAIAGTCLAGLVIFYFWPTTVPITNIDWTQSPNVHFLKNMDASGNACPSLHVATAFFSGIWLHHLLRRFGAPLWVLTFNWAWCIGIVYSTLAIRQHVAVDVFAGMALGGVTAYLSLRNRKSAKELIGEVHPPSI